MTCFFDVYTCSSVRRSLSILSVSVRVCCEPWAGARDGLQDRQLALPPSSAQVTFRFPVQSKGRASLSITRLTSLVCEATTARCRSMAHRIEVITAPPAHVHERSHVMSRNPGCTACLYCLLFDGPTFRDCLCSRSERSRPLSAIRFSRISDWLYAWEMHRQHRLAALHTCHVICCEKHCHCCSCQCSRALPLSWACISVAQNCSCDIVRQLILLAWLCYSD